MMQVEGCGGKAAALGAATEGRPCGMQMDAAAVERRVDGP